MGSLVGSLVSLLVGVGSLVGSLVGLTCEISLQVSSQPIPCMLTCKYRLDGLSFDSLFGSLVKCAGE